MCEGTEKKKEIKKEARGKMMEYLTSSASRSHAKISRQVVQPPTLPVQEQVLSLVPFSKGRPNTSSGGHKDRLVCRPQLVHYTARYAFYSPLVTMIFRSIALPSIHPPPLILAFCLYKTTAVHGKSLKAAIQKKLCHFQVSKEVENVFLC